MRRLGLKVKHGISYDLKFIRVSPLQGPEKRAVKV